VTGGPGGQARGLREARVLVLRALGLGDTLTAVPALRGLRRLYPGRRLVLAAPAAPGALLRSCGVVDDVVPATGLDGPAPGAGLGPHLAVNLHGKGPQSHRLLLAGRPDDLVAYPCPPLLRAGPGWHEPEHEVLRWCRLVDDAARRAGRGRVCRADELRLDLPGSAGPVPAPADLPAAEPYAVLHPGASTGARRWPAARWARLAAAIEASGLPVVLTGGAGERPLVRRVATAAGLPAARCTAGALELPELASLVAGAALLVCGDTGVAHLGAAFGTPSVLLFGPVPPSRWGPLADPERHAVLWHGEFGAALPGRLPGRLPDQRGRGERCDPALLRIGVDEVLTAVRRLEPATAGRAGA
jgi:ADP-heptose:LPS heptosyltransferase